MRPVMMPTCGHTISKAAAQAVLEQAQVGTRTSNGKKAMRCPSCNRVQPEVRMRHMQHVILSVSVSSMTQY